jgi:hypothetical protein
MGSRHLGTVLVDTNIILEAWKIGAWQALSHGYRVETVEDCVMETQTGFQNRVGKVQVDAVVLRASLGAPAHQVSDGQVAGVLVQCEGIHLDLGERSLWAHTLTRPDAWVLSGPDRASLRFGVRAGLSERMVSLETLLDRVGHHVKGLRRQYTAQWLNKTLSELVVYERKRA